jgi:hypothetical protein
MRASKTVLFFVLFPRYTVDWQALGPGLDLSDQPEERPPGLPVERTEVVSNRAINPALGELSPRCPCQCRHDWAGSHGNRSRVDGNKRTDSVEPRSYLPDASVDQTDARNDWACGTASAGLHEETTTRQKTKKRLITGVAPGPCLQVFGRSTLLQTRASKPRGASRGFAVPLSTCTPKRHSVELWPLRPKRQASHAHSQMRR